MKSVIRRRALIVAAAVALAGGLGACDRLTGPAQSQLKFNSIDITGGGYGQDLEMPDTEGKVWRLADFKGKVAVIFFGFAQCPDICPTTMAQLAELKASLGADGDRVQGVFITVDPERDSAELMRRYVTAFDPTFIALRGSAEQTAAAAKSFKVYYAKVPGTSPGSYTMDHTAGSYVTDLNGNVRLFTRHGSDLASLKADLLPLLQGR